MKKIFHNQKVLSGLGFVIRLVLGCMFIYGSLSKIRQPYDFLGSVYGYEIVGEKLGMFVAMTLPWAELLIGICLLGSIFVGGALLVSAGMGAMFTFVLGWAIYNGLDISCGCFGAGASRIGYETLIRAILICVFSLLCWGMMFLKPNNSGERE